MKLLRKAGVTSEIWQIFIQDSSSTTGAGLTGLTNASSSLTAYYHRDTDTTATAISLVSMTVGTFTSSGFKEIDATNMPGWYQFCPPNAALAASAKSCSFHLKGATNMAPLPIECQLIAADVDDTVRLGLTALPNAAAGATGGMALRVVRGGTAQSGNTASIRLDASASATSSLYNGLLVHIVSGTGAGQVRTVLTYNGSSKQANVDRNFQTAPDNTSVFELLVDDNPSLNASLQVASSVARVTIRSGTAQTGSLANTIKLDSGASSTNNLYNNDLVTTTGGTGLGQTRTIIAYNGTTKQATVDKAWVTTPDNTTTFDIYASTTPSLFSDQGVAQSGGATSITLASTASATSSVYVGSLVTILSGTGSGQTREITAYNGTTKVATVDSAWSVNPDSTSAYAVIPTSAAEGNTSSPTPADIAFAVWTDLTTGANFSVTDSIGKLIVDNLDGAISDVLDSIMTFSDLTTTDMTEAYASPTGALTIAKALHGMNQRLEEFSITGTTITVKKRDQSTTAMTFTMNSATVPTSSTQAT